ncbi:MAG: SDR family NAD(P)-dependent oxidoreductase [Planctomycetota bacterium]
MNRNASVSQSNAPVVFITGASAGIGAAAVEVFAAAGYDVARAARRQDRLDKIAAAAAEKFPQRQFVPIVCDVTLDASVKAAFGVVKNRFGKLDALINNAGYGVYGSVEKTTLDNFRQNLETNYFGAIRCTQEALPLLRVAAGTSRRKWGAAIVMVSSILGRRALPMMSSYCATKFAMEGLSEALRVELHDERISVSVVNPGVTNTEFGDVVQGTRPRNFLKFRNGMSSAKVAAALLQAVRRPRRNRYLTIAGKACIVIEWLTPRLVDYILLKTWRQIKVPSPDNEER